MECIFTHNIVSWVGWEKTSARISSMFPSINGCDTTSAFAGRGKRSAWDIWYALQKLHPLCSTFYSMYFDWWNALLCYRTSEAMKFNIKNDKTFL